MGWMEVKLLVCLVLSLVAIIGDGGRGFGRGNFRGSDRGSFRNDRGGRGAGNFGNRKEKDDLVTIKEVVDGLKLYVVYNKAAPSIEEMKKSLEGLHSRVSRPLKEETGAAFIFLFTSVESLEAAKVILEKDENVTFVDYMGMRSAVKQVRKIIWYCLVT